MSVGNFDQMLDSSYWQFVAHGQGTTTPQIIEINLVSPGFSWQIWEFQSTMDVTGKHLLRYGRLVEYQIGWR